MTAQNLQTPENIQRKIMKLLDSLYLEQQNLQERIEKIEKIMEQIIFQEKIERIEKEKASLLAELESLKAKGETKANELENEVITLRKEVKALKKLLEMSPKKGSLNGGNS